MNTDFNCTLSWIKMDLPHQIWEMQTGDADGSIFITRFLHNKPIIFGNNVSRCYASYLSPDFLNQNFTIIGVALFFIGIWYLINNKRLRWLLILVLLGPIFPLLSFPQNTIYQGWVVYILEGIPIIFGVVQIFVWAKRKFFSS